MLIFKESKAVMTVGIYVMDDTDPEVYIAKRECVYGFRPFDTPSSYENCLCFERNPFLCIGSSFILPSEKISERDRPYGQSHRSDAAA